MAIPSTVRSRLVIATLLALATAAGYVLMTRRIDNVAVTLARMQQTTVAQARASETFRYVTQAHDNRRWLLIIGGLATGGFLIAALISGLRTRHPPVVTRNGA